MSEEESKCERCDKEVVPKKVGKKLLERFVCPDCGRTLIESSSYKTLKSTFLIIIGCVLAIPVIILIDYLDVETIMYIFGILGISSLIFLISKLFGKREQEFHK